MSPGKLDWASSRFPGGLPLPPISKSDAAFLELGVEFLEAREGVKVTELNDLFDKARPASWRCLARRGPGRGAGNAAVAPDAPRHQRLRPPLGQRLRLPYRRTRARDLAPPRPPTRRPPPRLGGPALTGPPPPPSPAPPRLASPLRPPPQVGFPRRDPELLKVALDHTHRLVWVRATKQSRVARLGQLLGFARATRWGRGGAARSAPAVCGCACRA